MEVDINLIWSKRKTISIQVDRRCKVTVRVPEYVSKEEALKFVRSKEKWILRHVEAMEEKNRESQAEKLSQKEIRVLHEEAEEMFPKLVQFYASIVGVDYNRVTIRMQKTRWGSCSAKGNLNFNCLLMLAPEKIREYVVVHELCHRKHMDHSTAFWSEVERVLPDYRKNRKWLKENGAAIMGRVF